MDGSCVDLGRVLPGVQHALTDVANVVGDVEAAIEDMLVMNSTSMRLQDVDMASQTLKECITILNAFDRVTRRAKESGCLRWPKDAKLISVREKYFRFESRKESESKSIELF